MRIQPMFYVTALTQILAVAVAAGATKASATPSVDHHMHVASKRGAAALLRVKEAIGKPANEEPKAIAADKVITALDKAAVQKGVLLSIAYMYAFPEVDFEEELAKVSAENDFVARQVARHPERLVGFYSVNPLTEYALAEIKRCAKNDRLTGLKLHLTNSGVDLRDEDDLEALQAVFRKANQLGQPVIIHLRTRREDYGKKDAKIFINEVMPEAPDVTVQVAHLAGWSGMDEATQAAVSAFASAIESDQDSPLENLFFDTAETIIPESRAQGREKLVNKVKGINRRTADAIEALGPERVLFGTDWRGPGKLPSVAAALANDLSLPDDALAAIAENQAPYLE